MTSCAAWLFMRPNAVSALLPFLGQSTSVYYRCYCDELISGKTYLEYWLEWFRASIQGFPLRIVIHKTDNSSYLRQIATSLEVEIITTEHQSLTHAMADEGAIDCEHVALLQLGLAFAPPDLLARLVAHHLETKNDYSFVVGLPEGSSVEVFRCDLLRDLAALQMPGLPSHPGSLVKALISVDSGLPQGKESALRATALDARSCYTIGDADLPEAISVASPDDLAVARQVVAETSTRDGSSDPLDRCRRWKDALTAVRLERQSALRAAYRQPARHHRKREPPTVLFVANASAFSGGEAALTRLVRALDPGLLRLKALVALPGLFAERLAEAGVEVITPRRGFATASVESFLYMSDVLRTVRPAVVHFQGPVGVGAVTAAVAEGCSILQHVKIVNFSTYREQLTWADAVVAVSDYVKRELLRLDISLPSVDVVYEGVDTSSFYPGIFDRDVARQEFGIPSNVPLVVMIARYEKNKHHNVVVEACSKLRLEFPGLQLVLVGDGHEDPFVYEQVKTQLRSLGMEDAVTHLGFQRDIRKIEVAADVIVLCAEYEALGLALLEGMALGVPVIGSDSGGPGEVVKDGVNGYTVSSNDSGALAERLSLIVGNVEHARRLGEAGRRTVEEQFDVKASADKMGQIYRRLLAL